MVPTLVRYPAPFDSWLLLVGIVVDVNALEPNCLVPTTFEPFIVNTSVSEFCADNPVRLRVDKLPSLPFNNTFFQFGIVF